MSFSKICCIHTAAPAFPGRREADPMQKAGRSILSDILRKQMENLGYPSLSKFYGDHREIGYSYELLRQVVYGGRIPRAE
ncbi:MAG TPA: hypothetical protein VIS30_03720, partial [Candidatus Deferrimicrobiaceae bacterium]